MGRRMPTIIVVLWSQAVGLAWSVRGGPVPPSVWPCRLRGGEPAGIAGDSPYSYADALRGEAWRSCPRRAWPVP